MCWRAWNACWNWATRRENATWLGILYSAIGLGIFCCAADQPSGPLGDVTTRLLGAALAHWFSLAQPALSRWIVDTCAKSAATTVMRLLRLSGLF
jgi:hypothetical protein